MYHFAKYYFIASLLSTAFLSCANVPHIDVQKDAQGNSYNYLYLSHLNLQTIQELSSYKVIFNNVYTELMSVPSLCLDISHNKLEHISAVIGQFPFIKALFLLDNNITTISDEIIQLKELSWLDLSKNPIMDLPESFAQLSTLETLIIKTDHIINRERLKNIIQHLPHLTTLEYTKNVPADALDKDIAGIIERHNKIHIK